jgi:hypothetical protein
MHMAHCIPPHSGATRMAKMTKRQENNAARPEDEIGALMEELRTVDARKIIEGLREQVRQWKESDVYASWPLDMQLQIVGMSNGVDRIERTLALKILLARKEAQQFTDRINEHMRAGDVTIKGN